jgi:hypothetical protein
MSNETVNPIIELLVQQLTTEVTEQLIRQMPIYAQSDFLPPNSNELDELLKNDDAYQAYSLALAWIQDILLSHVDKRINANLSPEEAKHRYFEVLREADNEMLAENLSMNYATAVRLSQLAQTDKELSNILISTFLDSLADWLNHFSEAVRTGDVTVLSNYTVEGIIPLTNASEESFAALSASEAVQASLRSGKAPRAILERMGYFNNDEMLILPTEDDTEPVKKTNPKRPSKR